MDEQGVSVFATTVFMGFFAVMNPIANVPIFLSLTSTQNAKTTRAIAFQALLLAFIIIVLFSATGKIIFDLFSISLPALRMTGGLIVFLIGFHMLQGQSSSVHHPGATERRSAQKAALNIAVSPLAIPILAGPGTIATAMNFSAGGGYTKIAVTIGVFGVVCVMTYMFFIFGGRFVKYIGASALGAITRLMGLILAVVGTQMVIDGVHGAFPVT